MQLKFLFLTVAIFGIFSTAKTQTLTKVKQDSLLVIWNDQAQPDTIRLNAINQIASEGFRIKNPDSAVYYAQLQYDFASTIKNKEFQVLALNAQGEAYLLKNDPDKALDLFAQALELTENLSDKRLKMNTLGNISSIYDSKRDFEKALEYHQQILEISEEINDQFDQLEFQIKGLLLESKIYSKNLNFKKAIALANQTLTLANEINDIPRIAESYHLLGVISYRAGDFNKMFYYEKKSLDYWRKTNNIKKIAKGINSIGYAYQELGEYDNAIRLYDEGLTFSRKHNQLEEEGNCLNYLGESYLLKGEYEVAENYFKEALTIKEANNFTLELPWLLAKMGESYLAQKKYKDALEVCKKAFDLAADEDDAEHIACLCLYNSHKNLGNYHESLMYYEKWNDLKKNLGKTETNKALLQVDFKHQIMLDSLLQIQEKRVVEEAHREEVQQKNKTRNILAGGGLLLIIFAGGIYSRLRYTRKAKAIIEEQKKKVEQSEKYKEQFLANMSHEIRTPMHAISGMLKILERNEHPTSQDVYLNAMHTSSENLVVILNDVLDLSKIEAGKLEIESIPMNPGLVMENVCQILKFKAEEKGLTLSYEISNDVPDLVMGDPTRLNQILINLVGNAIKFTEKGSVTILLDAVNGQLHYKVTDTGIGIPKMQQESIFGAFEQAEDSTARHFGGTGLGLSISKQLVDLQQGKIWVESTEGQGSTFYVALPLTTAAADAVGADLISEEKLKAMAASLEGIRILIAEDNPFNQMIAQDDLSYYINDVTIDTVENGSLAVEQFNTADYDLILMDVQMPEMNGFEATEKIRAIEKSEGKETRIPIIAMTASLLKTEIDHCYDAGMDNHIPKPYTLEELIGPIFNVLRS
jgi:signal transduction histidine kinase